MKDPIIAHGQEVAQAQLATVVTTTEWNAETKLITRKATDIMAHPLITDGYALSGKPASLAYVHLQSMAVKRLKKHFPTMDVNDPLMGRLIAEAKLIVAKCMLLKYECRARRQVYDHLNDITDQVNRMVRDRFDRLKHQTLVLTED